jgi:hypothetical protein
VQGVTDAGAFAERSAKAQRFVSVDGFLAITHGKLQLFI